MVSDMENIIEKANNTNAVINHKVKSTSKNIDNINDNLVEFGNRLKLKRQVKDVLNKILYIKKQEAQILSNIVNAGLEFVYPNKDLEFNIEFVEKYSKIVPEFYLNELLLKPPFKGDGGGIISTISLLIYIAMVKITNKKVILLDEVESMVDINASKKLFRFLNTFAKNNGITITAITHKQLDYEHKNVTDKIKLLKVGGHDGEN